MANSPLKVGVVGMGGIGHTHCNAYIADELAELVCVCDLRKERADEAAEKFGVEKFYTVKEMLNAHPELDIVDVTTSGIENGSWHYVPVMEALAAGKHVLTEKPISNAKWCALPASRICISAATSITISPNLLLWLTN